MTRLDPRHPRYRSLVVRARMADAQRAGIVVPEGLIAHGRAEAFDYFLGERTIPSAARAERAAASWLLAARRPVVSVNGNVAALAAGPIAELALALPTLKVEVNLFHRTGSRARAIATRLRSAGVVAVLGVRPTATLPGLPSDRARVDREGIYRADVCLVPLEDGDRAAALRRRGIRVISIDLNPLSRTSLTAHVPIVDELTRALEAIRRAIVVQRRSGRPARFVPVNAPALRRTARRAMERGLRGAAGSGAPRGGRRASPRGVRGTGGPKDRTPPRRGTRSRSARRAPRRAGPAR